MGVPSIEFQNREVVIQVPTTLCSREYRFELTAVNMGNPHAVAILESSEDVNQLPLTEIGPQVEHLYSLFPNRTNFEIVNVIHSNNDDISAGASLRVRVWERSAGITMACGTGACASVVAARLKGVVRDESVTVHLPGMRGVNVL